MRLLSLDLERKWIIEDFAGPSVPFYAVLSHTWSTIANDEVNFEDIRDGQQQYDASDKAGYDKLRFCHDRAWTDGLRYFWIDTCCIKKSDSSELQRSLGSMFFWYQRATRCYVYLSDVSICDTAQSSEQALAKSRWFTRGWTLQELLAPKSVYFFSKEGKYMGSKEELSSTISRITRIPERALKGCDLSRFNKEQRLAWMDGRNTTVPEDAAYCLIGIFDVEFQFLYAEGNYNKRKNRAMKTLHQAIATAEVDNDPAEDVIRVGGACWSDLMKLGTEDLQKLDTDLDEYREWFLDGFVEQNKTRILSIEPGVLQEISQTAGWRMKSLLARVGVRYEDLSSLHNSVQSWEEPWSRYLDKKVTDQGRVQAFAENRWYHMAKHEELYAGITASRTLQNLMIWRGRWDMSL